jgi:carboxyl-terminal processing protease
MSLAEVHSLLAGQPGSNVVVSVVRARRAEPQKITITRDVVTVPAAEDKMLEDGIGYIKVDSFNRGKAQEVANKIKDLQQQNKAKKLILDLRNCAGGDEKEGIATANLFLNHGTIAYLQGQKYPKESFNADPQKAVTTLPLVVLVNRGTAGPAEIVAGAVLENARGDVLGDKTFGSGSIQKVIDMPDGSALILSVAKYYSPSGKALQDTAVTPNILVADNTDDFIAPDEDENADDQAQEERQKANQPDDQLNKAIEVLKTQAGKA